MLEPYSTCYRSKIFNLTTYNGAFYPALRMKRMHAIEHIHLDLSKIVFIQNHTEIPHGGCLFKKLDFLIKKITEYRNSILKSKNFDFRRFTEKLELDIYIGGNTC